MGGHATRPRGARLSAQSPPELGSRRSKAVAGLLNTFPPMHFRGCSSFSTVLAVDDQTDTVRSREESRGQGGAPRRQRAVRRRLSIILYVLSHFRELCNPSTDCARRSRAQSALRAVAGGATSAQNLRSARAARAPLLQR